MKTLKQNIEGNIGSRNVYLAQKYNTAVGSNHAEMCIIAAAKAMGVTLKIIYCSGPHCAFCSTMMETCGVSLGNKGGDAKQMGWTHPFVPLSYGQQQGAVAEQLTELRKLPKEPREEEIQFGAWGHKVPSGKYTLLI